jgi:hypothetical protein
MRTSSSPVSPAWKVTPAVLRSTSRRSSWLRSAMSFSVNTVTVCGMSRSSCSPLPMRVFSTLSVSLAWTCTLSRTVTVESVGLLASLASCAHAPMDADAASIRAPSSLSGAGLASPEVRGGVGRQTPSERGSGVVAHAVEAWGNVGGVKTISLQKNGMAGLARPAEAAEKASTHGAG